MGLAASRNFITGPSTKTMRHLHTAAQIAAAPLLLCLGIACVVAEWWDERRTT